MNAIVGKPSQVVTLSEVRALSSVTRLAAKPDG
jgi:hypothetical protein